ncbi:GntR family transcriptional regulator [Arcanobacterium canis]
MLTFDSSTPIYVQIAQDIRRKIVAGELVPGDQLMSTTQYATTYRINPATANKAFSTLTAEGLVYKQRGIGMFVSDDAPEILRTQGRQNFLTEHLEPAIRAGVAYGFTPEEIITLTRTILEEQ